MRCPLCHFPTATPGCPECGWPRRTDGSAAPTGPAGVPVRPAEVERAQCAWDLAAAQVAADGDSELLQDMLPLLRGMLPGYDEIIAAGADMRFADPGDPATVAVLLRALVLGELDRLAFLCLGPERFELHLAEVGPAGIARLAGAPVCWSMDELVPGLPTGPARRFHLAGGVGPVGPDGGPDPLRTVTKAVASLPALPLPPRSALVLVTESADWRLLHRIARDLTIARQVSAVLRCPIADPASVLRQLVRQAPLARSYHLVLLRPDETGRNRLALHELFGPHSHGTDTEVTIHPPAGVPGPVTLPIVHGDSADVPSAWTPARVVRVPLQRGRSVRVRVTLDDSAEVAFPELSDVEDDPRPWRQLLRSVPRGVPAPIADVVFQVELVDGPEATDRLELVRATISAIADETWVPGRVSVGLVGYWQHDDAGGAPLWTVPLGPPADAEAVIAGWRPRPNRQDYAAAVEDALVATVGQPWRPGRPRILVTVGSRAPYPLRQGLDRTRRCPAEIDWEEQVGRLDGLGLRRVAVWSRPHWHGLPAIDAAVADRGEKSWAALGTAAHLDAADTSIERLLAAIGVTFAYPATPFAYPARTAVGSPRTPGGACE